MQQFARLTLPILFVSLTTAQASQIKRITLAELQAKADLIVLAEVTKVVQDGNRDNVTIQVDSYLKGENRQTAYTFTLITRGGLKDFDPALETGDTGVFFLKRKAQEGQVEKAYWGSVATFQQNHFDLTAAKEASRDNHSIEVKPAEKQTETRIAQRLPWRITARPKQVFKSKTETEMHETLDIHVSRIWRPGLPEPLKISIEKQREYLVFLKYQRKGFVPSGAVWALPCDTILAGRLEKLQKPEEKENGAIRPKDVGPRGASVQSPTTYPVALQTGAQHPDLGAEAAALEEVADARLRCFAFTPDDRTVAASTAAGDVILWDAASGHVQQQFTAHQDAAVEWLGFAGDVLVTATQDPSEVKVWDARNLALRRTFQLPGPFSVSLPPMLSPDGKSLATTWWEDQYDGRDKPEHPKRQIAVWDLQTGRPRWSFDNKSVLGMSFSPNSDSIVLSYYGIRWIHLENRWTGTIQPQKMALYSVTEGEMIWEIGVPPDTAQLPAEVVFLPDGKEVLGAHGPLPNKREPLHPVAGRLMRFSAADGRLISQYTSERHSFASRMALLPDHTVAFYSSPFTRCVILWNLDEHHIRGQVAHRAMDHTAFSPDGKTMVCTIWGQPSLVDLASTRPFTIAEAIRYPMAAARPASLTAASVRLEDQLRGFLNGDSEEPGDALRSALFGAQTISLIYHHTTPLKEGQTNRAAAGLARRMHAYSTAIMMDFEGKPYSAISATFSKFRSDDENADQWLADMRLPVSEGYVLDHVRVLTRPREDIIRQSLGRCRQVTEAFAAGLDRLKADAAPLASWNRDCVDSGAETHPWPRYPHIEYTHQLGPPQKGPRQKLGEQWCEITLNFTPITGNPAQRPNYGIGQVYPLQGIRVSCNIRTSNRQLRLRMLELAKAAIVPLDEYEQKLRDEEDPSR
jgi:hypothetical protein